MDLIRKLWDKREDARWAKEKLDWRKPTWMDRDMRYEYEVAVARAELNYRHADTVWTDAVYQQWLSEQAGGVV